jgi:alkylhydroperoxidase family enzyme
MDEIQTSYLGDPPVSDAVEQAYEENRSADGYIWNVTRLWSWRPDLAESYTEIRSRLMETSALSDRDFAVLVASTAGALKDSYCSLAWGRKLAALTDGETAAAVVSGQEAGLLSEREETLAAWARQIVRDPNATTRADVDALRRIGLDDREIFEATLFVGLRLAFSSVNDALGTAPDRQLAEAVPEELRTAVAYGRPPAPAPSSA